jgi:hypothetical protein
MAVPMSTAALHLAINLFFCRQGPCVRKRQSDMVILSQPAYTVQLRARNKHIVCGMTMLECNRHLWSQV